MSDNREEQVEVHIGDDVPREVKKALERHEEDVAQQQRLVFSLLYHLLFSSAEFTISNLSSILRYFSQADRTHQIVVFIRIMFIIMAFVLGIVISAAFFWLVVLPFFFFLLSFLFFFFSFFFSWILFGSRNLFFFLYFFWCRWGQEKCEPIVIQGTNGSSSNETMDVPVEKERYFFFFFYVFFLLLLFAFCFCFCSCPYS